MERIHQVNPLSTEAKILAYPRCLYLFLGLLAVGFLFDLISPIPNHINLFPRLLLFVVPFDSVHAFASLVPAFVHIKDNKKAKYFFLFAPVITGTFIFTLYYYSQMVFFAAFAILILLHLSFQQFGWMAMSRRFSADRTPYWLDKVTLWSLIGISLILANHKNLSTYPVFWLHAFSIVPSIPQLLISILHIMLWIVLGFFIAVQMKWKFSTGQFNRSKLVIIFTTWVCFYATLVVFQKPNLFFSTLIAVHGGAYIYHCGQYIKRYFPLVKTDSIGVSIMIISCLLLCGLWALVCLAVAYKGTFLDIDWIIFLPFAVWPIVTHFLVDSWMWRSIPPWVSPVRSS